MGLFNTLVKEIQCENCGNLFQGELQFKFGDTWLHIYNIGDKIKWGGNDVGKSGMQCAKVYGILASDCCPKCGQDIGLCEFDITIENDIIIGVDKMEDIRKYDPNEGDYYTIES